MEVSFDTYRGLESAPDPSGVWPATSLGLIYSLENRPEEGNEIFEPILREREEVLDKDDTSTSE